ncbi:MAG: ABC transporter ATP-binding protein [Ardenticatenaceae bacterium]|nr:ABC transporter ATP-binding protein [Ardenticatenaceae bacterium]
MNANTTAIVVEDLTKRFGAFTAVNQINFQVNRGEIFGFLGPNGSGKTTTIRMTLGLMQPTSGSINVLNADVSRRAKEIRPQVGYMSQRFSLYNDLTVQQNLQFYGKAYGLTGGKFKERMAAALKMAGLEGREDALTRELSGGWRQRLALSVAIIHRPILIFLDEPTAGVDPVSRRTFWDLLYGLVAEGITVFVTTHYMDEAEHCHRLALMQRGSLIASGSPTEIKQEMMRGEVLEIATTDAIQAARLLREASEANRLPLEEVELYGALVHVVAPEMASLQNRIAEILREAEIEPQAMTVIEPSLEDAFIASMNY